MSTSVTPGTWNILRDGSLCSGESPSARRWPQLSVRAQRMRKQMAGLSDTVLMSKSKEKKNRAESVKAIFWRRNQ